MQDRPVPGMLASAALRVYELPETWALSSRLIASRFPCVFPVLGAASRRLCGRVVAAVQSGRAGRVAVVRRLCL